MANYDNLQNSFMCIQIKFAVYFSKTSTLWRADMSPIHHHLHSENSTHSNGPVFYGKSNVWIKKAVGIRQQNSFVICLKNSKEDDDEQKDTERNKMKYKIS